VEDDAHYVEGPGEKRAYRWVEIASLDARGEAVGPVRRVSSEKGRAAAFELTKWGSDLVVLVQDEAAPSEGAGGRIVRHLVKERVETADVVDGGVGHALADLVPVSAGGDAARWLAWTDTAERFHMMPLAPGLVASARPTLEPALDGARVLAASPPDTVYALTGNGGDGDRSGGDGAKKDGDRRGRPELRRFLCK
jgi:hypothetical protein